MTNLNMNTLRPGLLVSLKTGLTGNVNYEKTVLEQNRKTDDGAVKAKWETTRIIHDPEEHEAGRKAQMDARVAIVKVCTNTAFGLLCPEANAQQLDAAIAEARSIADKFNASAKLSRLHVYVIAGRVAADDVEAVKAINNEVRSLLEDMKSGIKNVNVKAIRQAADEAKRLGEMLTPDAAGRVTVAIEAARAAARKIVKAGEQAAQEVDISAIKRLEECRTSFLDLDGGQAVASPEADSRALDLLPESEVKEAPVEQPAAEAAPKKKASAKPKKATAKNRKK